ncbi:MAG: hypothetical protein R3F61_03905 [Myxococcota bacterium]
MHLILLGALAAEPQPLMCCDEPRFTEQLKHYLKFQQHLVGAGSGPKASGELYAWAPVAKRAIAGSSGPDKVALTRLAALTESLKNAKLPALRQGFVEVSQIVSALVIRHAGGSTPVYEAVCDERPWLQRSADSVAAPYTECEGAFR